MQENFKVQGRPRKLARWCGSARGPHNDVVVPDESVSGLHATLERRGDEWFILDASSRNGTFVRSERIAKETKLQGPTVLQFGTVQAMFIPRRSP